MTVLYKRVEKAASANKSSANEVVSEAVRRYLWELNRRKISEESTIYRQQHAWLKKQYGGQYIAMYNGQVVDHDSDFQVLRRRIRQQFEDAAVMITLVEEIAEPALARHGFRFGDD